MPRRLFRLALYVMLLAAGTARAASAQTCITIDESHDTLARDERTAALVLIAQQFEAVGQRPAEKDCAATYTLTHLRLGTTIIVTLSGPLGSRQATAVGLDDLPAVYSQMVRSLQTGQPVGSLAVVDRTNVSASQEQSERRIQTEGTWYARLGHASLFADSTRSAPVFGFGYRAQFDRLGLDFSFLNIQPDGPGSYSASESSAASLIKLEGLYYTNPTANRSAYFGGGLSYGRVEIRYPYTGDFPTTGRGSGLQGELTAGYEIARVTSMRVFAQADVTLPFYNVLFETLSYPQQSSSGVYRPPTVTTSRQYVPSLAVSIGFGWQRGGGR